MSVLDRFKDTEKYPRQMRELGMLIILNRRSNPGIFLKDIHADRCGWFGKPSQLPDAEHTQEEFGDNGKLEDGILFRTPRLVILRGGYKDDPTFVENSAEKGAIEGLTRSLAAEFAPKIRVNSIAPSILETPLSEKFLNSETKLDNAKNRHPLKQIGSAKDISEVVKFLLEDNSKWMTGQIIPIDGGMSSVKTN